MLSSCKGLAQEMPFISRDWRGPGEDWIKCQDGWEIRRMGDEEIGEGEGVVKRRRTKTEGDAVDNKENIIIRLVNSFFLRQTD